MGYVDEDGYLYLVDRKKDMIDSGGMKVYPKDVEEIAARHAAVILREGATASAEELRGWINERVAARYQRVSEVVILKVFPRSAAGKTLKREMREPYWAARGKKI